jgi:anhydro-N-acetylmuramic acid kinase
VSEYFIGLMSGTSLDALDAVLVDCSRQAPHLIATRTQAIGAELREGLRALCEGVGGEEIERLGQLDAALGEQFAALALALLAKAGISTRDVRAIGSHGQTIRHRPAAQPPFTLQIGDPNVIAARTGITTVADFRRRDVALGGQGAPLVPAFHAAVFRSRDESRVVANIGGMANVTLLPGDPQRPVTGFDTGPGNVLMDGWAERHLGRPYDADGAWAAGASADSALLAALLAHPFFAQTPPKSCGREQFNLDWLDRTLAALEPREAQTVQATLCALTVRSLVATIRLHAPDCARLLVCGGGARNTTLMQHLQAQLADCTVETTAAQGIAPQWVECCAFAWLARETLAGRPGNLPAVTGAARASVLGAIYPA